MRFTKMHGAANDYVVVNLFEERLPLDEGRLARTVCCRRTGVGADGLILIGPSSRAPARMQIWNADGSPAEMCGNGLRCAARFLFDRKILRKTEFDVETARGTHRVRLELSGGVADSVSIDMGQPLLDPRDIPVNLPGPGPCDLTVTLQGRPISAAAVGMGNPHLVLFVDDEQFDGVARFGPELEHHPAFPNRTNVEFAQILGGDRLRVRVWERGVGETPACGTGACAAVVAGVLRHGLQRAVTCEMPGGALLVEWLPSGQLTLTGPAEEVFRGEWFPIRSHRSAAA